MPIFPIVPVGMLRVVLLFVEGAPVNERFSL